MAITADDLRALHSALEQAKSARRACQDAAEVLGEAETKLDGRRVMVDVPCTDCPRTVPVVVTVGSGTVPLRELCRACARRRADAADPGTVRPQGRTVDGADLAAMAPSLLSEVDDLRSLITEVVTYGWKMISDADPTVGKDLAIERIIARLDVLEG